MTIADKGKRAYGSRPKKPRKSPDIPERLLAKLWRERAARQAWFRTSEGARLRVVYPGRPGSAAGPDFRNAILAVDGLGLVQGDVEIHRRQRDWDSHGHGQDPNYSGVILHAALEVDSSATVLKSGHQAPVVSLAPLLEGDDPTGDPATPELWALLEGHGYPRPTDAVALGALLDRAGDQRFLLKSAGFQRFLKEQEPEQTLYEGLMEGLGYRHNQQPFLKLAGQAPYKALQRGAAQLPKTQRAEALESWLVRLSGLAAASPKIEMPVPRTGFGTPLSAGEWHCFRVRPANHPRRRIVGASRLLDRYLDGGLVAGLTQAAAGGQRKLISGLAVEGNPSQETAYIGSSRARDLAVNVVLPMLHALPHHGEDAGTGQAWLDLYHCFGKLQDNELTREMAGQLVPPCWPTGLINARRQQGLLHLHSLLAGAG